MNPVEQRIVALNQEMSLPQAQPEPTPLTPEVALVKLMRVIPEYAKFGIKLMAIFSSSVARDEARPDSDVNILVFTESFTFNRYINLKVYLEDLLEKKVDLASFDLLSSGIIRHVLEAIIPID